MTKLDRCFAVFVGAIAPGEITVALLTGAFWACGLAPARSESYVLNIRQTLEQTSHSLSLHCSDEERDLCRGTIKLAMEGREQLVSVVACFGAATYI